MRLTGHSTRHWCATTDDPTLAREGCRFRDASAWWANWTKKERPISPETRTSLTMRVFERGSRTHAHVLATLGIMEGLGVIPSLSPTQWLLGNGIPRLTGGGEIVNEDIVPDREKESYAKEEKERASVPCVCPGISGSERS